MEVPEGLRRRIDRWETLSRWERSEVGRDLRRLGLSYGEIRRIIDVKKGTLATWCRDIRLTDEQKEAIQERTGSRAGIPVDTQWRRRLEIAAIRDKARRDSERLMDDPFWVAGVVLYWAEGSKTRNHLELANSDPRALSLFIAWIRQYVEREADFAVQLFLHTDNNEQAAKRFWIEELGIEERAFYKTFIKPDGTGHRTNRLERGVARVKVKAASDHWNSVMEWVDCVSGGFAL